MRSIAVHLQRMLRAMRNSLAAALLCAAGCCPPESHAKATLPQPPAPAPEAKLVEPPDARVASRSPAGPPIARKVDVVDKDFGLSIADPYRWMEGTDNAEYTTWLRAQGDWAATQLAKIPGREKLHARVTELGLGVTAVYNVQLAGQRLFHYVLPAGEQLAKLAVRDPDGKTRVLVDPKTLGDASSHASLHAYSASPDGKLVSYTVSTGGGEVGKLHIMDVATGKELPDVIERIWGEGAASWLPDGKSFFYTQLAVPQPGVDPMTGQLARLHKLGDSTDQDITILGRNPEATLKLAPEEWPGLWAPPGTGWVLTFVGGAHSEQRVAVAKLSELDLTGNGKTPWRIVSDYADGIESAVIHGDRIYLQTYKDAPNRKIISVPVATPELAKARLEIAEDPNATISGTPVAKDAMYLLHMVNGFARLSRWPWSGKPMPIALPYEGWAPDLAADMTRDGLVFQVEPWLHPGAYFAYDPKTKQVTPAGLASSSTADSSSIVAEEVEATSADGTKIPLSILHAKDLVLDGSHPTMMSAYGAYGSSQTPGFSASRLAWIERGGVVAVAHVRGGGEKGRRWQDDGSRDKKMNGIRDLIACGEYLVEKQYTSRQKLAITGGSMGGILIGRALTERPDLFAAAQIAVGAVNPLRILAAENGANQKSELGDPATEAGYKSLLEMDPYHHVKPDTAYPAVIFTVGANDHRVAPWMTGKMAARLRASSTSRKPILVRVESDAGHGLGSTRDQAFAERADVWSFFLSVFGDPEFTVK
ncbi:MAG: f1pep1 2 [Myxococcales bacterium]|nr:f1pep1 2 [Myxococcales bacterium]